MSDAVVNGLISGGLALLGVVVGAYLTLRMTRTAQRHADEKAARDSMVLHAQLMAQAVIDIRAGVMAHDKSWYSVRTRSAAVMITLLNALPALREKDSLTFGQGMARSAGVLWDWYLRGIESQPRLSEAVARMTAASFQLTLCPFPEVVEATRRLTDAVSEVTNTKQLDEASAAFRTAVERAAAEPPWRNRWPRIHRRRVAPSSTTKLAAAAPKM